MTPSRLFALFLVAYVWLCVAAIRATPYRTPGHLLSRMQDVKQGDIGAPDERQHINYIRHIAQGRGFPVFKPDAADLYENYQAHQPPLYYLIAAPLAIAANGNDNTEKWLLRSFSVLIGLVTLIGIFTAARAFTDNEWAALFAATFAGSLPMFIALTSAVTNDALLMLMGVLLMNIIASARKTRWDGRHIALLGVVLGFSLLTKTTGLLFFPVAAVALFMKSENPRPNLTAALAPFLLAFLIASPWLIRNHNLYGDSLAIGAFREASVGNLNASDVIAVFGVSEYWLKWVALNAVRSFWGVFGYFDIYLLDALYWSLTIAFAVMLTGHFRRTKSDATTMHKLNAVLFAFVLAGFIAYNASYFQAQARYLYPAIFAIACAASFGLWRLCNRNQHAFGIAATVWTLFMLALNAYIFTSLLPLKFALMQL